VTYLLLVRGTFTLTMLRFLERSAYNDAERALYRHALEDKARHVTYGLEHLKYAMAQREDMKLVMEQLFFFGDRALSRELKDPVLREALAIVFAGSLEDAATAGLAGYDRMMREFMGRYLDACRWLGVERDPRTMPPRLAQYAAPA
jgi:hypothetical protein